MSLGRHLSPWLLGLGVGVLTVAGIAHRAGIRINLTDSIPRGLYRVVNRPFARGSIVLVCLPKPAADLGRARGYIPSGACDDGSAPVGKPVVATQGDTVQVFDRGVVINGTFLSNSAPLERDSDGRPLPRLPMALHILTPDEIWLLSSHSARSYDSRYFGAVASSRVVAQIEALVTAR
ncbi:MAG TPA: conjugative transfer signal peptidase TraF [Gemmatimonadaceae bacterium]|nr:conjugative transfer signal peptidase TraF [Gemmatimonadaceae bacterium]